jgi:hypothetical protein
MPPELKYTVETYSRAAIGGAKRARIRAEGSREQLFELIEHLRAPVTIYNPKHEATWWGYIASVKVRWRAIEFGVDIDTMTNKIAVAYTDANQRFTTAWSTDATSAAEYGTKEILLSGSNISEAMALAWRDVELQRYKYPVPTQDTAGKSDAYAIINCRGWFDTLDWRYYANNSGQEAYIAQADEDREIGEDDRPILAQSFQLSSSAGWSATDIYLHAWKYGSPVDNLVVALYSDSGGDPNLSQASCTTAGGDIPTTSEEMRFTLSSAVALSTATTYWVHVSRSGAVDLANYYLIDVCSDAGYESGVIKLYNTGSSAWVSEPKWGDMLFRVVGETTTTAQIAALIANVGEFYAGSSIESASGIITNPYRNGDYTALTEILDMLKMGTSNDKRLLCESTIGRILRVYEEPAKPDIYQAYGLDADGKVYDPYGNLVENSTCLVAQWCALKDVIPASADLSKLADPNPFFIEEAEYDAESDQYRVIRASTEDKIFDIGDIVQG